MLASDLPFPIARLVRQSRNAKSYAEAHNRAWFAWEASVRLAAVAADPQRAGGLRHGSVGDWARLVPAGGANFGESAIVDLHAHAVRLTDPNAGRRASIGRRELLDVLVAYRNRVIGHGPSRDEEFCRAGASVLRDALPAAWGAGLFLPPDARLVHVETIEIQSSGARAARVFDLGIETPTVLDPESSLVPEHLAPHRVHLRRGASWTALFPWLVFDPADGAFFWFQALKRRPDYIDYSSGRVPSPGDLERLAPGAEVELDRRLRGTATEREAAIPPERAAAGRRFAGFEILGEIGRGGMGVVHLANQVGLARLVALKTLPPESRGDPVLRARFHREIEALARCDHPNVVKIHASGEEDGVPYFAMEYVAGADLRRVGAGLARTKSMERALELAWNDVRSERGDLDAALPRSGPPVLAGLARDDRYRAAASLVRDAALGVQALHDCGIVHRDLSPANILVTSGDARAVVMDLGLALFEDKGRSLSRDADRILGTLRYMSPEQLQRNLLQVDRRTDVYSLGAVLYELLADRPFFDGDTEARLIEQVLRETPVPVRRVDRAIPEDLARIVQVATDKDARLRYDSASAFAADLEAFIEGRPILARASTPGYVLRQWVRRNPALATVGALGSCAALLGAFGIGYMNLLRMREQAQRLGYEDFQAARLLTEEAFRVTRTTAGVPGIQDWIRRVRDLASRRDQHSRIVQEESSPPSTLVGEVRAGAAARDIQAEHDLGSPTRAGALVRAQAVLASLEVLETELLPRLEADLDRARRIHAETVDAHAAEWERCRAEIARGDRYPPGFALDPQEGLIPLGADPGSGLQEFVHAWSGATPARGSSGELEFDGRSGIVLVLLPGGRTTIGAGKAEGDPHYDPEVRWSLAPRFELELEPYFISKFEVTQSQWVRLTGRDDSRYSFLAKSEPERTVYGLSETSPADELSWKRARDVLGGVDLLLPTEAQWEHAARAGSPTPWHFGADLTNLPRHANIADAMLERKASRPGWTYTSSVDDGFAIHAPVGSLAPNAFGLHDVHGNVLELCHEATWFPYPPRGGAAAAATGDLTPLHGPAPYGLGMVRGGSWANPHYMTTSAHRYEIDNQKPDGAIGVRPVRIVR